MNRVSLTVSPPTRVVALVGALVLTGLAAIVFMLGRGALAGEPAASAETTRGHAHDAADDSQRGLATPDARKSEAAPRERLPGSCRSRVAVQPRRRRERLDPGRRRGRRGSKRGARSRAPRTRRVRSPERPERDGDVGLDGEDRRPPGSRGRDRQAPGHGRRHLLGGRRRHDRAGDRRGTTTMSEPALQPSPGRELYVRHARLDGRSVARLRAVDEGHSCVVETEVWPNGSQTPVARRTVCVLHPRRSHTLRHARGRGVHRARLRSRRLLSLDNCTAESSERRRRVSGGLRDLARPEIGR